MTGRPDKNGQEPDTLRPVERKKLRVDAALLQLNAKKSSPYLTQDVKPTDGNTINRR